MSTWLRYSDAVRGRYRRLPTFFPGASYFRARGAIISTNEFADPELRLSDDPTANVIALIESCRKQGHHSCEILLDSGVHHEISENARTIEEQGNAVLTLAFSPKHHEPLLHVSLNYQSKN